MSGLLPKVVAELRLTHPLLAFNATQVLEPECVRQSPDSRCRFDYRPIAGSAAGSRSCRRKAVRRAPLDRGRKAKPACEAKEAFNEGARERSVDLPQPGTQVSALVDEVFGPRGARPTAPVRCSSIEMYWELLATGRFVAVLPLSLLTFARHRDALAVLPIKVAARPHPVGIVSLRNRTLSRAACLFIEKTRDVVRPLQNHAM
jgi:DNA-binding transcriptional LysR family regulator